MKTITYNKLIRDKIPEIIKQTGKKPVVEKLEDDHYLHMLNTKLSEELTEYQDSNNIEELADLVEVIYAILEFKRVSLEEFEKLRQDKVLSRGAFKERLLLKEVLED